MATEAFEPSADLPLESPSVEAAQKLQRIVNDEIARIATQFDGEDGTTFDFLCECGILTCAALVHMNLNEYATRALDGPIAAHDGS